MLAACFIGLIVLSFAFWNSGDPNIEPIYEVVDTPATQMDMKPELQEKIAKELPLDNEAILIESAPKVADKRETIEALPKEEIEDINTLAFVKENGELLEQPTLDAIELKAKEVLDAVEKLERSSDVAVTDAEIDELLRAAQREIFDEKNIISEEGVDAMALLNEVEQEIDGTFRDQIFDALKDGYLKLRTAVADRNN